MSHTRYCEVCKQPIEPERAESLPATRLCTKHGREIGRYGGEFVLTAKEDRISKQGSLKRNYRRDLRPPRAESEGGGPPEGRLRTRPLSRAPRNGGPAP